MQTPQPNPIPFTLLSHSPLPLHAHPLLRPTTPPPGLVAWLKHTNDASDAPGWSPPPPLFPHSPPPQANDIEVHALTSPSSPIFDIVVGSATVAIAPNHKLTLPPPSTPTTDPSSSTHCLIPCAHSIAHHRTASPTTIYLKPINSPGPHHPPSPTRDPYPWVLIWSFGCCRRWNNKGRWSWRIKNWSTKYIR